MTIEGGAFTETASSGQMGGINADSVEDVDGEAGQEDQSL
jgi:hypothetical protein